MGYPHLAQLEPAPATRPWPWLMGIVNVTPDSFSDTGRFADPGAAADHARRLLREGAAVVDLGAEASSFFRPGVVPVDAPEQLRRLLPVLERLQGAPGLISIDTRSAEVARAAVAAGAHIINDISAGESDAQMLPTVAELGAGLVLMHMAPGYPATPAQDEPGIVEKVCAYLARRADIARRAGVRQIWLDPGIGFGKTMADNWRLVDGIGTLLQLGFPVVLGISRKRFLDSRPVAGSAEPAGQHPRDAATAALTRETARRGVQVHRVHDVALCASAVARSQ